MIDSTDKKIATIGIELSNDFNSNEEKKAATPKAVKDGIENHEKKADPHSQYAMKESPTLSGVPKAPTAAAGNNTTQIANTAFVQAAILALINGAPTTLDTLKELAAAINNDPNFSTTISNALALKAPLLSPGLTGTPTAPTAPQATNNTQIATTAFVRSAISALVGSSPEALDTLNELAAALGNDPNFATTMTNALAGKQPLNEILTAYSALNTAANKLAFFDGRNSVSLANLTAVGRVLIGQESVSKVLEYLGLGDGSALPVGVPVPWPLPIPPLGWLKYNGAPFDKNLFPKLALVYPSGILPDLRGEFIRGWDDGRGIDNSRGLLSFQAATSFTQYGGNYDVGSGHAIGNHDGVVDYSSGFSRFPYQGPSVGDGVNHVTVRPRNLSFNYIVRAA
ncbi:tail fiber protein [Salmonella enterica]|nr:tail fiber protein [Salmonella enterica]